MAQKPSIPKGTRDFSPAEVAKRNYISSKMKHHFEVFGFQPIETPSFENSETLMGKYGEEGDRLIFKILNSGDYLEKFNRILLQIIHKLVNDYQKIYIDLSNDKNRPSFIEHIQAIENDYDTYVARLNKELFNNEDELTIVSFKDILFLVKRHCYDTHDKVNVFINKTKEEIEQLVITIFSDFFISLKGKHMVAYISEKALRYDLTVPFARYVVQHQNEIEFPFKRYQIQPVWRADRPQKGRFREFYQCDADVVGSTSLWQEVELVQLYDAVFTDLGLGGTTIKINNRKILSGIAEVIGAKDKLIDFTVALDKLDKIGEDGVKKEMLEKGISATALEKVQPLFQFTGTVAEKIEKLNQLLATSVEGLKGVEELRFICETLEKLGLQTALIDLDVTLARGLNYYTGAIFEVVAPQVVMGSIGGGGRYDDLTGIFGLKNMSGVGISFGLDRIYLVLEELGLFPDTVSATTKALFINYGNHESLYAMEAIFKLRRAGIKVELYPDAAKIAKQFQYADKRGIPFAVIAGLSELERMEFGLKNLQTGEQVKLNFESLKKALS
ncbi:histidine--tRNA ligase [Flavobacterium sp.]|uniref:histidine--tRNA ligase n=1 Tax=Flavobacterium sp. TaxID=239 RepID=UPI0025C4D88C|nr:histidine--tRNA ligase [Flavobacterium sp.]MBA4153288.1 histidine--tRNA ligase [Flavobacterium sp.]